ARSFPASAADTCLVSSRTASQDQRPGTAAAQTRCGTWTVVVPGAVPENAGSAPPLSTTTKTTNDPNATRTGNGTSRGRRRLLGFGSTPLETAWTAHGIQEDPDSSPPGRAMSRPATRPPAVGTRLPTRPQRPANGARGRAERRRTAPRRRTDRSQVRARHRAA